MIPLLYETTSINVSLANMHFLGRLSTCTSCIVTEERNGDYTLSATILNCDSLADLLSYQNFICVKANPFDRNQFFEIYEIVLTFKRIEIKAKHIKHCCFNNVMTAGETESGYGTPKSLWNECADVGSLVFENSFTFESDITDEKYMDLGFTQFCTIGNFLYAKEGSLLSKFGGEYWWNNLDFHLLKSRGKDSNYYLRWGKNISELEQTQSSEDVVNYVVGYASVHDDFTGAEIQIGCEPYNVEENVSKLNKVRLVDASYLTKNMSVNSSTGEGYTLVKNACRVAVTSAGNRFKNAKVNINIKVTMRAELDEMKEIGLCDTVHVILDKKGTEATAQVTKVEWDCLQERWKSLELGTTKVTVADYLIGR